MTKLIEADALFINLDGMMAVSPTGYIHGETVADMISDAPTVEAIPVEWINKYTNEHRTYMPAFSEMVACWYDEKEKREYEMASDMRDYCEKYEPTYNPEDGSL